MLWPTTSPNAVMLCLISILALESTYARPFCIECESCRETKTKLSTGRSTRGSQAVSASNQILQSPGVRSNDKTAGINNTGAIVGGTIAAGVVFGLVIFMCFKLRKEYLLPRQRHPPVGTRPRQASTTTPEQMKQSLKDRLSSISATLSQRGEALKRAVSRNDDTSSVESDLSFGDLTTTPAMGHAATNMGPIPAKAANTLGFRFNDTGRRPLTPLPHTIALPPTPTPTPTPISIPALSAVPSEAHEPCRETGQKAAAAMSQASLPRPKSSSSSLSSLGRTLLQDTMHPPEPQKYPTPPIPQRALPPLPAPPLATPPATDDDGIRRGQSRRYFVPVFKAEDGQLESTSSDERIGVGSRVRDSTAASRYSMGDNVI